MFTFRLLRCAVHMIFMFLIKINISNNMKRPTSWLHYRYTKPVGDRQWNVFKILQPIVEKNHFEERHSDQHYCGQMIS